MKQTLPAVLILFSLTHCFAQTTQEPKRNAISFEIGKTGLIYNVNFDHKLSRENVGFRIGAGSNFAKYLNAVTIGAGGYYLLGKRKNFFELGIDLQYLIVDQISNDQNGFSFVYPDYSITTLYPSLNLGFRSYGKKTIFRAGFSPGIIKSEFIPGGYISYGVIF